MIKIRLARAGARKRPFYHVVVSPGLAKRDGRYIERLGFYNPQARGGEVPLRIDTGRVEYWLGEGAQISDTVKSLVRHQRARLVGEAQAEAGVGEAGVTGAGQPTASAAEAPEQAAS